MGSPLFDVSAFDTAPEQGRERLGLGINLFANKQTLTEQLGGIDQLNSELSKRSNYYEKKIFSKSSRQN